MAIKAIGIQNVTSNYNTSFTSRKNKPESKNEIQKSNTSLVKIPVIVMMAMAPISGCMPTQENNSDKNKIETVAPQKKQSTEKTYNATTSRIKHKKTNYITSETIQYEKEFWSGKNNYVLYFVNIRPALRQGTDKGNEVNAIFMVPKNWKPQSENDRPPELRKLIYHDPSYFSEETDSLSEEELENEVQMPKNESNSKIFTTVKLNEIKNGEQQEYDIWIPDNISTEIRKLMDEETQLRPTGRIKTMFTPARY